MLCGCDYLEPIKGVGAKTALKLIKDYDTFEDIMAHLRKGKNPPPEDWPHEAARELFKHPDVTPASEVEVRCEVLLSLQTPSHVTLMTCYSATARVEGA